MGGFLLNHIVIQHGALFFVVDGDGGGMVASGSVFGSWKIVEFNLKVHVYLDQAKFPRYFNYFTFVVKKHAKDMYV